MSEVVSRGQALQVSARVATQVNWDKLDGDRLQNEVINLSPEEFGCRFTLFLQNGARMIISEPGIITIDRSQPFDLIKFLGGGWTIDIEEQDERSLALTQLDVTNVRLGHMLKPNENYISGKEKLERLKKMGYVCLDAKVFQTFWENQALIPEFWKRKTNNNTTYIFFDSTVLVSPAGRRCVLSLYWCDDRWHWGYGWLADDRRVSNPSAVLVSI